MCDTDQVFEVKCRHLELTHPTRPAVLKVGRRANGEVFYTLVCLRKRVGTIATAAYWFDSVFSVDYEGKLMGLHCFTVKGRLVSSVYKSCFGSDAGYVSVSEGD